MLISAADLMVMTFDPPSAEELVDLVDSQACSPECLFGHPGSPCNCRCGGKHHGLARDKGTDRDA